MASEDPITIEEEDVDLANFLDFLTENLVAHGQGDYELKLGTVVKDEKSAFELYNNYAINKGFSVRKGKVRYKHKTSIIRERTFCCSKEGSKRDEDPTIEIKVQRVDTREECKAHVRFKVEDGVWVINRFVSEHSHPLVPPEQRHLLRSGRKITETSKGVIDSMTAAGIRPMLSYRYLVNEAGGVQNVGHTKRDHLNYLNEENSQLLEAGDAQSLL